MDTDSRITRQFLDQFMEETQIAQIAAGALSRSPLNNPKFPPSPYYRFLEDLAVIMQPTVSVELGVCGGGGSLHLCRGWLNGIVVGVDITIDYPDNIQHIERFYSNYRFILGDSVMVAPRIYKEFGQIDILFIDTVHTYDKTMQEFYAYQEFLSDDSIVCFDDLKRPGMSRVWEELPGRKLRLDYLHPGEEAGFGVIY